jgi:hypothetical protein
MNLLKAANFREDYLLQSSWIAFYGYVMMLKNERVRKYCTSTKTLPDSKSL